MAKAKTTAASSARGAAFKTYAELAQDLKNKNVAPLYVLFGDEEYLIERAVKALERQLIAPGCQDADAYTGDWSSSPGRPDALREMTGTPPFLSERRLVILKNTGLFANRSPDTPELTKEYSQIFSDIPDFCCLVLIEEKVDKRKKALLDAAGKIGMVVQVDRQSTEALCKWVASTLHRENIRITVEAIGSLVDRTESSMRILDNEIRKILLYCANAKSTEITIREIDEICMPDIRGSIFQMTDAIGVRNISRALTVLDTLIAMKEPVPKIRFMLARHIRQLICAKELVQAERVISVLKVVPFVARNLVTQARSFTMDELTALYEACADSDFSVKTGKIEDRLSMEILLVSAAKSAARTVGSI